MAFGSFGRRSSGSSQRLSSIALSFEDRGSFLRPHARASSAREVLDISSILEDEPEDLPTIGHLEPEALHEERQRWARASKPKSLPPAAGQTAAEKKRQEVRRVRIRTKRKPETPELHTWARFTPASISGPDICLARTWAGGRGGQCKHAKTMGSFCGQHGDDTWKKHGRVDGPINIEKLREFLGCGGSAEEVGQYVRVRGDGWGGSGRDYAALVVEARSSTLCVAPLLGHDGLAAECLALRHCCDRVKSAEALAMASSSSAAVGSSGAAATASSAAAAASDSEVEEPPAVTPTKCLGTLEFLAKAASSSAGLTPKRCIGELQGDSTPRRRPSPLPEGTDKQRRRSD